MCASLRSIGLLSFALLCFVACQFDPQGLEAGFNDTGPPDGAELDGTVSDAGVDGAVPDAVAEDATTPCETGAFECLFSQGSARLCQGGEWVSLGPCFLGCEEATQACRVPSNVDPEALNIQEENLGDLVLPAGVHVEMSTDDGSVVNTTDATTLRPGGEGEILSGVGFYRRSQPGQAPSLGVFVLRDFTIPEGTTVDLVGSGAFVVLATRHVVVEGVLDGGAHGAQSGPGGYDGGEVGLSGDGLCPGQPGQSHPICPVGCASGSGGGGLGGKGGDGGEVDCTVSGQDVVRPGGLGGGTCGSLELAPLVGGSGGGGGVPLQGVSGSEPGLGGGGGGAIQISARATITLGVGGVLTTPGGGGGQTFGGGGAGGGAGGAVLLETPSFIVASSSVVAVNGGGGGGGDCT